MIRLIVMYALLIPCVALFIYQKNKGREKRRVLLASIFKGIAIWIILCGALAGMLGRGEEPPIYMLLIVAGLAMGLAGDIALSLPDPGFLSGMLFFGLGHCCYITALIFVSTLPLIAIPIFVIAYAAALFVLKKTGKCPKELLVPVMVYSGIILAMASLAVTMAISAFPKGCLLLAAAVLFAISDAMLARNKFADIRAARAAKMTDTFGRPLTPTERGTISLSCYFLAQSFFAVSIYCLF